MNKQLKVALCASTLGVSMNAHADWWTDFLDMLNTAGEYTEVVTEAAPTGFASSAGAVAKTNPQHEAGAHGELKIAAFNVKGFPTALNGISNAQATQLAQSYVNNKGYDIVGFQENWVRNGALMGGISTSEFPYRSDHYQGTNITFGDGLSLVSKHPFAPRQSHNSFNSCAGTYLQLFQGTNASPDCETEKGFTVTEVFINADLSIHVYNTHMDTAGGAVKQDQFDQLENYMKTYSVGKAIILMGDFNSWIDNQQWVAGGSVGGSFAADLGLTWSCSVVANDSTNKAQRCSDVDHIAYRGNAQFSFETVAEQEVHQSISDHNPLVATLRWTNNQYSGSNLTQRGSGVPYQSSTAHGASQWSAVDNNVEGNFGVALGVHTAWENNPWWEFDMYANANITDVEVFHRTDWGREKMTDFHVFISETSMRGLTLAQIQANPKIYKTYYKGAGASVGSITTKGALGRHVRIQSALHGNALMLSEVKINGHLYNPTTANFFEVPGNGRLKQVSVGEDGRAWGVSDNNLIYHYSTGGWHNVGGNLVHIAVGNEHNVWGIGYGDAIFYYRPFTGWIKVDGSLRQLDVGADGTVWGVNANNDIYHYLGNNNWEKIPGKLTQISVANQYYVCGVNMYNDVFCWNHISRTWQHDPSIKLRSISVSKTNTKVGIGLDEKVYVNTGSGWVVNENAGTNIKYIEIGQYDEIWSVDHPGKIYSFQDSAF